MTKIKTEVPNTVPAVVVYENVLTPAQCQEIINAVENSDVEEIRHNWILPKSWRTKETKRPEAACCYKTDARSFKFAKIVNGLMQKANKDAFKFDLRKELSQCDLISYREPGDFASWHADGYWDKNQPSMTKGDARKLTCVIQLTDPRKYKGADLELYSYNHPKGVNIRKQGTAIIFPSFCFHQVTPLISGERYSLASFLDGPFFK